MKIVIATGVLGLLTLVAPLASASVIDFETLAANSGGNLTGIPDSPLVIGIATLTGGELRDELIGLAADQTGVYATEGLFGSGETNPLVITFAMPISDFSVLLANGDAQNQGYTVSDNLGERANVTLALAGSLSNAASTVRLPGTGITSVSITSTNTNFWDFAIDNVTFTGNSVPEPASAFLVAFGGLAVTFWHRRTYWINARKDLSSRADTSDIAQ